MSSLQCPTTLVVARHAKAEYVESWFSDEGGSLTDVGRGQAVALAEELAARKVAHVWTSDTSRAVQTGEIAAARLGVGVTVAKALREVDIGTLRGQPFSLDAINDVCRRWFAGDLDAAFTGGESGAQVVERYRSTLAAIADQHPGELVLVITHQSAVSITLPCVATGVALDFAREHQLRNGESAELVADTDGWRITRWGDQER
jgi:probable phosphoglycerate mutase